MARNGKSGVLAICSEMVCLGLEFLVSDKSGGDGMARDGMLAICPDMVSPEMVCPEFFGR